MMLGAALVSFLLSSRLQRLISEPILRLVETMRTVSSGKNYSVRAVRSSDDEVGALIDGFNQMLDEIGARHYVPKPIRREEIFAAMDRQCPGAAGSEVPIGLGTP